MTVDQILKEAPTWFVFLFFYGSTRLFAGALTFVLKRIAEIIDGD